MAINVLCDSGNPEKIKRLTELVQTLQNYYEIIHDENAVAYYGNKDEATDNVVVIEPLGENAKLIRFKCIDEKTEENPFKLRAWAAEKETISVYNDGVTYNLLSKYKGLYKRVMNQNEI